MHWSSSSRTEIQHLCRYIHLNGAPFPPSRPPTHPLNLRERQTVRLQLLTEEPNQIERILRVLVAASLMRPPSLQQEPPPPDPVSENERRELARILGRAPGKPLSESIIEERGER